MPNTVAALKKRVKLLQTTVTAVCDFPDCQLTGYCTRIVIACGCMWFHALCRLPS